jgi:hypothetical protein
MSRTAFAALLVALLAAPAAAQMNLTGDWNMTIQSPQGTNTVKVTLTQDGETVSGRVTSQLGELPVTGALTGDDLKIAFTLPIQGQSIVIVMTGKVEGPTLAGKVQFGDFGEGDWTATRAEAAESAAAAKPAGAPGGASGEWDLTFKTPKGDVPATATINQDGGKLSGTLSSPMGQAPFTGTLEGTSLRVTSNLITPRGTLPMTMKGDIAGDAIANGKAKIKGVGKMKWTAKRVMK